MTSGSSKKISNLEILKAAKNKPVNISFKDLKLKIDAHSECNHESKKIDNEDQILLGLRAPQFEFERHPYILYPNDNIKVNWDIWISLILLITCFQTPLNFAF